MLAEALIFAANWPGTPPAARPHLSEAIGLWARGKRQYSAWTPHLERVHTRIKQRAGTMASHRTVAVLGSGPLFDVPLKALAKGFDRVILVDRVHLLSARRQTRQFANVDVLWRDLCALTQPTPLAFLQSIPDLDWVISLNLVSQLGFGAPEGREREVIDAHLDGLTTLGVPVSLATDFSYRTLNKAGGTEKYFDLLYARPMPEPASRWEWEVAPFGEEGTATRRVHDVGFYPHWPYH